VSPLPRYRRAAGDSRRLPSSLLERRPDIAAAQRAMEAANARIGVARAAMFPALNINAAGGGVGGTGATCSSGAAARGCWARCCRCRSSTAAATRPTSTRSEAALEESVAAYRQSVLVAFAEVEDNLAGLRILAGQAAQIDDAVVSARRSADLAQKLYDAGRSSYLDLLDAQRNLAASGTQRGPAARQPRGDDGGPDPRAGRRLGRWLGSVRKLR
jgi:multidrug efflux system outer membrane protein